MNITRVTLVVEGPKGTTVSLLDGQEPLRAKIARLEEALKAVTETIDQLNSKKTRAVAATFGKKEQAPIRREAIRRFVGNLHYVPSTRDIRDYLRGLGYTTTSGTISKDLVVLGIHNPRAFT